MLDDGLLDVRLLPQLPKEEIPEALRILLRDGLEGVRRTLVGARVPWLEIETEESLQINLDGEPLTDTRFRFELLPRRLSMKLPTGCPLLVMLISRAAGAMEQRSSPFRLLASGSVSCCPSGAECPEADAPYTRRMPLRDIFTERADVDLVTLRNLGPLRPLAGKWEGSGVDEHPVSEGGLDQPYTERFEFQPIDPQANGLQLLYGLRYHVHVMTPGEITTFHDQVGYWLWELATGTIFQAIAIPRGQVAMAAGPAAPDARTFTVRARAGDVSTGIISNPFLNEAFRTVEYALTITVNSDGTFTYEEDTVLMVRGRSEPFHHVDRNTLRTSGGLPPLARLLAQPVGASACRGPRVARQGSGPLLEPRRSAERQAGAPRCAGGAPSRTRSPSRRPCARRRRTSPPLLRLRVTGRFTGCQDWLRTPGSRRTRRCGGLRDSRRRSPCVLLIPRRPRLAAPPSRGWA